MEDHDYQSLQDLLNSYGWKLISERLQSKIKDLEVILLEPDESELFSKLSKDEILELIKYAKMQRKYLLDLQNLPKILIETKIK